MKKILLAALILAFLLPGCIPSLHPLYTDDVLAYRPELLGKWTDDQGSTWHFQPSHDGKYYSLDFINGTDESGNAPTEKYEAHLVQLGNHYFLDFYPEAGKGKLEEEFSLAVVIATHSFARVDFEGEGIVIRLFDYEWLEKLFKERKIRMKHEKLSDGEIILTASSKELQGFVHKYAEEEKAYIDPVYLNKTAD
jgi:hypothetical protein